MITHAEAGKKFERCRNKYRGYKLADNTRLQKRGHAFAVRLHEIDVVMIRPDGTYRLNAGGYRTITTKNRMNMALPGSCCVSQANGIWFVGPSNTPYHDGILVGSDGKAVEAKHLRDLPKIKRNVDRRVANFAETLSVMCIGRDLGTWKSHGKRTVPRSNSKTHLMKLWKTIRQTVPRVCFTPSPSRISDRLVHLTTLARGHGDPEFVWDDIIRKDCVLHRESRLIANNFRSFMRTRKTFIAELIADGTMQLS